MNRHELKCEPGHFRDVQLGLKKYEVRYNDRGFTVGDEIELVEYHVQFGELGGRLTAKITHILHGGYGLKPGFVVLGIEVLERIETDSMSDHELPSYDIKIENPLAVGEHFGGHYGFEAHDLPIGSHFVAVEWLKAQGNVHESLLPYLKSGRTYLCEVTAGARAFKVLEVRDGS